MQHVTRTLALVAAITLVITGCSATGLSKRKAPPLPGEISSLVVVGFRSALNRGTSPGVIRRPISGDAFMARPIPQGIVEEMTDRLFERISGAGNYDPVSPYQAQGVMSSLISSHSTMTEMELLKRTGAAFSSDAVLAGYLYRWEERLGGDYAVKKPASVAFDLFMIRPGDGEVLWKVRFDITQKSLSENILDVGTFLNGRGKWMTAEQLAALGLDRVLGNRSKNPPQPPVEASP